ncbi:MAG: hypothetical protein RR612_05435, partial [Oscillospiraceae bacterium]
IVIMTGNDVKAAMQKTALTAITRNSEETFPSKREGYTGAYEKSEEWNESIEVINAAAQLKAILHLTEHGDDLVKLDAFGTELYRLQKISLKINNPSFKNSDDLQSTLNLTLVMPVRYGTVKTVANVAMHVEAKNRNKFS